MLQKTSTIKVAEEVRVLEAVSAMLGQEIEQANKYAIYNDSGSKVFYAVEQTNCCVMQLKQCLGDCAPWDVDITSLDQPFLHMSRPFTCTFCCFNRPEVAVTDVQTGQQIGSIVDPCACCDLTFSIKNQDDQEVMQVKGGCCQMGLCCPLPCGPCAEVHFDIDDMDGNQLGSMTKKVPGCCKFCLAPDVDNYIVDFAGVSNPQHRALLMGLAIFTDFRYFNNNPNDDDDDGGADYSGSE